jgi:competence protein ComGC
MRCLQAHNNTSNSGFTLVEMLVVAPIVLISITFLVGLMINIVGDSLIATSRSRTIYTTHDALNTIENDVTMSSQFLLSTGSLLSPQGKSNDTTAFTSSANGNTLILKVLATDKNPLDATRSLVVYADQPFSCSSGKTAYNTSLYTTVIYFVKNGSLWRRTIVPAYNQNSPSDANTVCSVPWQRSSCSVGYTNTSVCKSNDIEVEKNIASFTVNYYAGTSSTTISLATSVKVQLATSESIAGSTVTYSASLRATKINN